MSTMDRNREAARRFTEGTMTLPEKVAARRDEAANRFIHACLDVENLVPIIDSARLAVDGLMNTLKNGIDISEDDVEALSELLWVVCFKARDLRAIFRDGEGVLVRTTDEQKAEGG